MDHRPIGVFDSGLGGLTCVKELRRLMPHENIVYFGDTGRVPYGSRSAETIIKYARQDAAFLNTFHPKAIVIACGTVSATALEVLRQEYPDIPILGVVDPTAQAAAAVSRNGKIGLLGTEATIKSGAYERAVTALRPGAQVFPKACPLFVPLVENRRCSVYDPVTRLVVQEYLDPLKREGVDTLVLGCTHYPLLRDAIADFMGDGVTLIDAGATCARRVVKLLAANESLTGGGRGRSRYFVSDTPDGFAAAATLFLGEDLSPSAVEQIDITAY